MTTATSVQEQKRKDLVEKLWQRTKPDAGTTEAEKAEAKSKIEAILNGLLKHLVFDWNKGKFVEAKAGTEAKATGKAGTTSSTKASNEAGTGWTTKDLASYMSSLFGIQLTAKNLRRHLRSMDRYNDGKMTHYQWKGQSDPLVKEIVESYKAKKAV